MNFLSAHKQGANTANLEDIIQARCDLLPKIIDLTERLQVFTWGLQNYFIDVYLTSDSSRSLEQLNYTNRKYRANRDLDTLQAEIQQFRKEFGENHEEINEACKELDKVTNNYNESCIMVDGTYVLQTAVRDLKSLDYIQAIVKLRDLHARLDELILQGNLAKALGRFRAISNTQLALSQGQLDMEFSKLFKWSYSTGNHNLRYSLSVQQNDPVLLESVLRALYDCDLMTRDIQLFSHFFVHQVVTDVIKHNCEIFTEEQIGALEFNIIIDLNDTSHSIPTIFNNLTAVFEFLQTTIGSKVTAEKTFFECLGDCNREDFFNKVIDNCIKDKLPCGDDFDNIYKEISAELSTFNKFLVNLKYVDDEDSPLKQYFENTDMLLYFRKCKNMVAEIRNLMNLPLTQETVTVGSDLDASEQQMLNVSNDSIINEMSAIFFPKCVISQNAKEIGKMLTDALHDSVSLPAMYGYQLVQYVKAVAILYQSTVSHKNQVLLKTHPLEIALFFNNCHYLAHLLVGPPWKNILPESVADALNTTLLGHIYELRLIGMEKLSLFLRSTREDIFDKIMGFFRNWKMEAFESYNKEVNYVLGVLKMLRTTWQDLLPARMLEYGMCSLVDTTCNVMMIRAFRDVEDISEEVVNLLAARFQYAIDEIKVTCPRIMSVDPKVVKWEKMSFMPKLLTAQMLEIYNMWNENESLRSLFSCEEIRLIIKMRFPSDEYRLKIMKGIQ